MVVAEAEDGHFSTVSMMSQMEAASDMDPTNLDNFLSSFEEFDILVPPYLFL